MGYATSRAPVLFKGMVVIAAPNKSIKARPIEAVIHSNVLSIHHFYLGLSSDHVEIVSRL